MQRTSYIIPQLNSLKSCYQAMFSGLNGHLHCHTQVITTPIQAVPFERRQGQRAIPHAPFNFLTR